jgi:4'-phosphopantetheinyl transferase EntD
MPDLAHLTAAARALLPPGTAVAGADPQILHPLLPGEPIPGATPSRLREFSAGRHAARAAIAALGHPVRAIPQGDDRAPLWPAGLTGTITHSRTACLAAVSATAKGLGLDLEDDSPLDPDLWDIILLPPERLWAETQPDPARAAKLIFSAKEAAYKAQYPTSLTLFGFDTLLIQINGNSFTATFQRPIGQFEQGSVLSGRHSTTDGQILTAVILA